MSLFRRAEARTLSSADLPWLGGGVPSMGARRALSIIPVYAAVRLISETIASLPLHAYRRTADGRQQVELPRFAAAPVDGSTTQEWIQRCMTSLLIQGNAYGLVTSDGAYPSGVLWLNPDRVRVEVPRGEVLPTFWVDGRWVDRGQMVHIPAVVVPGSAEGVSPIGAFATTFDGALEVQRARREYAKRRQVPGFTLRNNAVTLNADSAEAVAARAESRLRSGGVFAHGKDWDFNALTVPPADVAFLESIKADANQIASIYTVPPELIGGTSGGSLTYNTVEGQLNWILTMTTRTWITKLEAAFTRLTPRPQYLRFAPDAVVRTDIKTRHEVYRIDREIGLKSIDELRDLEDLPPLPNGQGEDYAPLSVKQQASPQSREGQ